MATTPIYPLYTESPYVGTEGKVLLAQRAYVAAINTAAPAAAAAGVTPSGWSDLGSIDGSKAVLAKADPTIIDVTTGLYQVLRGEVPTKDGDTTCTINLVEYEPATFAAVTGDTVASGGIYVGGHILLQKALLLVGQNPVTRTEFHHWSPKVGIKVKFSDLNDFQAITLDIRFYKFYPSGDTTLLGRDFLLQLFAAT